MKKKIFLTFLMVAMLVCVFALAVSARTDYREEHTYNYYDEGGKLLYSATTIYAYDANNASKYRFEVIIDESEMKFAKTDASGNALTWYVVSTDKIDDIIGGTSQEQDGVINITVASVLTSAVGTIDVSGQFTYNGTVVNGVEITAKNVVSASFFGMDIKKFPDSYFKAEAAANKPNGSTSEYCQMTNGSYLLALYLPKTLTSIPNYLCQRAPVRVVEFEDNMVADIGDAVFTINGGESNPKGPFAFCANLKAISIPENVEKIVDSAFRECISLKYVKIANTVTTVENNTFFRCSNIETFIMGEKMTFCGYLSKEAQRFYVEDVRPKHVQIKYYYVSPLLKNATSICNFEFYRKFGSNGTYGDYKDVIFMFPGSVAEAALVGEKTGNRFKCSYDAAVAAKEGLTFVEPISYEEYLANKTYYDVNFFNGESRIDNKPVHLLVYNVPKCDAFYDGAHIEGTDVTVAYANGFTMSGVCTTACTREGCIGIKSECAPIVTPKGYAVTEATSGLKASITSGFAINNEALALYESINGVSLEIGLAMTGVGENSALREADTITLAEFKATKALKNVGEEFNYAFVDYKVNLSTDEQKALEIIACLYVSLGESVELIQSSGDGSGTAGGLQMVSYKHIYDIYA